MTEIDDMAGDWIKMRTALANDPAVIAIALDLDVSEFEVVGMLHHLWSWADTQSQDGHIKRVTEKWVDRYVHHIGFAKSMSSAGWLIVDESGITFPNFERHNGDSAKKRAEATDRKRKSRQTMEENVSHENCDKNETREEKRRDKEQDQKRMADFFAIFWKLYPNKAGKQAAVKAWSKIRKADVEPIMKSLALHVACEQWVKDDGKFIPHPATWLNGKRWEDEVKPYDQKTNGQAGSRGRLSAVDQVREANDAAEARRRAAGPATEITGHLQESPPLEGDWEREFASINDADGKIVGDDGRPVRA